MKAYGLFLILGISILGPLYGSCSSSSSPVPNNNGNAETIPNVFIGLKLANEKPDAPFLRNNFPNKPVFAGPLGPVGNPVPTKNFPSELPAKPLNGPIPAKPNPAPIKAALPIGDFTIFLTPFVTDFTSLPRPYICLPI